MIFKSSKICKQEDLVITPETTFERIPNPDEIILLEGYRVEVFANALDTPISMVFTEEGDLLIAEMGEAIGTSRVIRLSDGNIEVIAEDFNYPITGINVHNRTIYVSHRGVITAIRPDGTRLDLISGLPSFGDYSNNQVIFGPDGKMYFGQGTATNSGVVGLDNPWVYEYPFFHDYPGAYMMVSGQNFATMDKLIAANVPTYTGAYSPYGVNNFPFDVIKGITKATGSILRANPDGSELELVAWGLRNPFQLKFDQFNRLYAVNHGPTVRGSRPIANAPDEFHVILMGIWYGWPDYVSGLPVTLPRYKPEDSPQPEYLFINHPNVPPQPFVLFPPQSTPAGFDFNYNINFGPVGDVYVAEFGGFAIGLPLEVPIRGVGHKVTRLDMNTRQIITFAVNYTGLPAVANVPGGFSRPVDLVFGPDGAMYILDLGIYHPDYPEFFLPNTGVIWRISRI